MLPNNDKKTLIPHFPAQKRVYGAGFLIYAQDTQCFLALHHLKEDVWGIPGGKVEAGECYGAAALRELRGETGYAGTLKRVIELPLNIVEIPGGRLEYQTFLGQVSSAFTPELRASETKGFKWVKSFEEWPEPRQRGIDFLAQDPACVAAVKALEDGDRQSHYKLRLI